MQPKRIQAFPPDRDRDRTRRRGATETHTRCHRAPGGAPATHAAKTRRCAQAPLRGGCRRRVRTPGKDDLRLGSDRKLKAYAGQSARERAVYHCEKVVTAIGGAARTPEALSTHLRRPKHCASHVYAACEAVAWSTYFRVIVRRRQAVVRGAGGVANGLWGPTSYSRRRCSSASTVDAPRHCRGRLRHGSLAPGDARPETACPATRRRTF